MQRSTHLIILSAVAVTLASCYGPDPRPFAGRGRSLDQPPRYGDPNRYVEPVAPTPPGHYTAPTAPQPTIDPSGVPTVDPGLSATPPTIAPTVPGGSTTPPAVTPPVVTTTPAPTTPAPGDVPYARAVPGKPGFVYSPKDAKKIISVEGLRPGQKARDPETGDIFRVPY